MPVRYDNFREDSARWLAFRFRPGDIVISTPAKSGTTWLQMICALLIFQDPDLPAPLAELSPWLDSRRMVADEVYDRLDRQRYRRFIKTHTPLDGLPMRPDVTYLVGARHPLDAAVSLYHQFENVDRFSLAQADATPRPDQDPALVARPPMRDWLSAWISEVVDPQAQPGSLQAVFHQLADAWSRRAEPHVALVHYADLSADLAGQMRGLADLLQIATPPEPRWQSLVEAATFASMRARADRLIPRSVAFTSATAFFRSGRSGAGRRLLDDTATTRYHARAAELAPSDLLAWLHRPLGPAS
jgi:aryl sulfotransferase